MQEGVDRAHPLFDPLGDARPFAIRDDARDDIEGDEPLFGLGAAIDVEGDAGQAKDLFGLALFGPQSFGIFTVEPVIEGLIRLSEPVI